MKNYIDIDVTQEDIDKAIVARISFKKNHDGCWGSLCPVSFAANRVGSESWTTDEGVTIEYENKTVIYKSTKKLIHFIDFVDANIDKYPERIQPIKLRLHKKKGWAVYR